MKRNFGLDITRTIAIWMVLLQHAGINIYGLNPIKIGGIGVEIFFVLSGFLIGGILFKDLNFNKPFFVTLWNFWTRRWLRILPLYYLVLIFKFVFIDNAIGANILYYFFFLQNNFYGIQFLEVSWSLVIEEWFYIFSPLYLFIITRNLKSKKLVMLFLVLFIFAVNILRLVYVHQFNVPYQGVNGNFPFRFDSLFLGVILSYMKFNKMKTYNNMQNIYVFILGFVSFLAYLCWIIYINTPVYSIDKFLIPRTLGFLLLPFTVALMIPFIESWNEFYTNTKLKKILFGCITYTSIFTFALYLIHPFYYGLIQTEWFLFFSPFFKYMIAIILTYITAYFVYNYFEKPILNIRDKLIIKTPVR